MSGKIVGKVVFDDVMIDDCTEKSSVVLRECKTPISCLDFVVRFTDNEYSMIGMTTDGLLIMCGRNDT